jgi:hypothetical protein
MLLVAYGTLGPGRPNHHRLSEPTGRWLASWASSPPRSGTFPRPAPGPNRWGFFTRATKLEVGLDLSVAVNPDKPGD